MSSPMEPVSWWRNKVWWDKNWGRLAQSVAALASVIVAVFAIVIQGQISNQDKRQAAIDRSIEMYNFVAKEDWFRDLDDLIHEYQEVRTKRQKVASASEEDMTDAMQVKQNMVALWYVIESNLHKKANPISMLSKMLVNVSPIHDCVYNASGGSQPDRVYLCDRDTLDMLLNYRITEIYFAFKPLLYCDEYLVEEFNRQDDSDGYFSYTEKFERIVQTYLEAGDSEVKVIASGPPENKETDAIYLRVSEKGCSDWAELNKSA
ncbi:MAG: hypothetical protein Kilf2KO_26160 [Rhodospirillales bacterium]